jgi:regulator of protease activity HflC (stomatin/prohibitin superfamily)
MAPIFFLLILGLLAAAVFAGLKTVNQGTIAVVTMFGRYQRILSPGLNFLIPFVERVYRNVSIQNQSMELSFQAITTDQANVYFKAMLLYSVLNHDEKTVVDVAFKFIDSQSFNQAMIRTVEGAVRSFVATKKQTEILALRGEIVSAVKETLDPQLEGWGYHLIDLQMNDIVFDQPVMESMARVVASQNLLAAAENEGRALLVTKTKQAEAEGNAIRIAAEADRTAQKLRGEGIALFRSEAGKGMSQAVKEMEAAGLDASLILFQMWTEAMKHVSEYGRGNVIFLDGSPTGMKKTLQQMTALQTLSQPTPNAPQRPR